MCDDHYTYNRAWLVKFNIYYLLCDLFFNLKKMIIYSETSYIYMCISTVLSDGHPRRALHGVRVSRTTAVRALRPCASRTHPQLRATGADLLRKPGPLSSVSALRLPWNIVIPSREQRNATSGNPRRSGRPISNCWYSFRHPSCPPSASLYAYEWLRYARVEKNFWWGKSANSPCPSENPFL